MSLIQMSLTGSVFILAVAALRLVLLNRLPKATFPALWTVALLRLMVPVSLPLPFRLPVWAHASQILDGLSQPIPLPPLSHGDFLPSGQDALVLSHGNGWGSFSIWTAIWAVGMAVCALYFTAAFLLWVRRFRFSTPVDNMFTRRWLASHPLRRTISIRQSMSITSPLTYGVIRPVILMPESISWDNEEPLRYILEHEYIHLRRYDAVTKLVLVGAVCVHWFNPAVWLMYLLFNRDMELACDEGVIQKVGFPCRSRYATALIDLEERRISSPSPCQYFCKNAAEERITAIMKSKPYSFAYCLAAGLFLVCAILCFSTSALASPGDAVSSQQTPSWVWPTRSTEITTRFGTRVHPITGETSHNDSIYIAADKGEPVVSSINGQVTQTGFEANRGNYVVVTGDQGIQTVYGQLYDISVQPGTAVAAGDQLGTIGATGKATGPCLSYSVLVDGTAVDPMRYFDS